MAAKKSSVKTQAEKILSGTDQKITESPLGTIGRLIADIRQESAEAVKREKIDTEILQFAFYIFNAGRFALSLSDIGKWPQENQSQFFINTYARLYANVFSAYKIIGNDWSKETFFRANWPKDNNLGCYDGCSSLDILSRFSVMILTAATNTRLRLFSHKSNEQFNFLLVNDVSVELWAEDYRKADIKESNIQEAFNALKEMRNELLFKRGDNVNLEKMTAAEKPTLASDEKPKSSVAVTEKERTILSYLSEHPDLVQYQADVESGQKFCLKTVAKYLNQLVLKELVERVGKQGYKITPKGLNFVPKKPK